MGTVTEVLKGLMEARDTIERTVSSWVAQNANVILDYNKNQLQYGLTSEGNEITPKYARSRYARAKQSIYNSKPTFGTPDLKLTGAFYQGFKIDITGDKFIITSTDFKADDLEIKYSENIYGLSDQSKMDLWNDYIYIVLISHIDSTIKKHSK